MTFPGPLITTTFLLKLTTFWGSHISTDVKKRLYISLVCSRFTYYSQIWRPYLIKDITALERIQRRVTKYILNDFHSDYKSRLINLNLLPLMQYYEYLDLIFIIKCFKSTDATSNFNTISNYTQFFYSFIYFFAYSKWFKDTPLLFQ